MSEVIPLPIVSNEFTELLIIEVGKQLTKSAKYLALVQNAAMYYQALVTKRKIGTTNTTGRDAHAKQNYLDHTVPAFFAWWKATCPTVAIPEWLPDHMGKSTLADSADKVYNSDGHLWKGYLDTGARIRRDFNPIWDSFRGEGGDLPSGQQESDCWDHLQKGMYYNWKHECLKKRKRAAKNTQNKNNPVDVTGTLDGQAQPRTATVAPETAQQQSQGGAAAGGSQPTQAVPSSAVAARWLAQQAAQNAAKEMAKQAAKDAAEEVDMQIKQEGLEGGEEESLEDGEDGTEGDGAGGEAQRAIDQERFGEMPENWFHTQSLAFAIFGRPAGEDQDVDLALDMSGGGKTGAAATTAVGGASKGKGSAAKAHGLGKNDLNNLDGAGGGAGGKQSRAEVKKERHAANSEAKREAAAAATAKFRAEALKAMTAPVEASESTKQLASSVEKLTANMDKKHELDKEAAAREEWAFQKKARKECWEEFVGLGLETSPAGQKAKAAYVEIISNVPGSMTQPGVGAGAIGGGSGGEGEGAAGAAAGCWEVDGHAGGGVGGAPGYYGHASI